MPARANANEFADMRMTQSGGHLHGSSTMQRSRDLHATHASMVSPESLSASDESSRDSSGRDCRNDTMPDCAKMRPSRLSCALEMQRRNSKKSRPPFWSMSTSSMSCTAWRYETHNRHGSATMATHLLRVFHVKLGGVRQPAQRKAQLARIDNAVFCARSVTRAFRQQQRTVEIERAKRGHELLHFALIKVRELLLGDFR